MDSVSDSSAGSPPSLPPVDTSTDSAPVGDTSATDGGDTSVTSAPASTPASSPPPIKDSFEPAAADPATRSAPTAPAAPATGTDTGNKVPPNTFQADRNKDTFTPASGQPTSGANKLTGQSQPPPAVDAKKADDPQPKPAAAADKPAPAADAKKADDAQPKPTAAADKPAPAADAKKADEKKPDVKAEEKKPAEQPKPAADAKKADEKKPDVKADEKKTEDKKADEKKPAEQPKPATDPKKADEKKPDAKADDKKPDAKAEEKKADAKKADEKKADEKKAEEKKADTKKADEKKPDTKADDKKAEEKKPDTKKADDKKTDDTKKPDDKKADDAKKPDDKKADDAKKTDDKKPEEKKAEEKKGKPAEVKIDKESVKVEKKGDIAKKDFLKAEGEKKGGADLGKARENKGPTVELAKGKTGEAKIGDDVGPGASISGKFDVTAGTGGLDVNGSVKLDAHLLNLTGKAEKSFEFEYGGEKFKATLALQGDLKIGGDANLKANFHVGTDGRVSVNLGADGFVGAKGELKGTLKLESRPGSDPNAEWKPLVEGNASVSAYAGAAAGAKFNVQGDIASGKLGFEAKAFASVGVGAGFGVDGTVNFKNVAELGGRVGMKFAGDVGNAVNLPGATMDYFNASSRAAELDKIGAPITAKAHAGDAWMRQGYDKMLPSEAVNKAISTLDYHKNFDMVDTAAGIGSKDGIIGKVDLEAAMRNESFPQDVRAAAYHLLQSGAWDRIQQDGLVSKNGQNPWKNMYTPENQAHFKGLDQAETARRDMAAQSQNLQRTAGGMWAQYQGANNPNQLRDLLGRVDTELGNTQKWGGVKSVRGGEYDAVQHEANLRNLRQQIVNQLGGK